MENVKDAIINELKKSTGKEQIEDGMSLFDDLGLSSLEAFEVLANLEEIFDIEIDEEVLGDVSTVGEMIQAIDKMVNEKEQ